VDASHALTLDTRVEVGAKVRDRCIIQWKHDPGGDRLAATSCQMAVTDRIRPSDSQLLSQMAGRGMLAPSGQQCIPRHGALIRTAVILFCRRR
jgi:hypothetical protein